MPSACSSDAYALHRVSRWSRAALATLACGLGVLQGCRGGDAVTLTAPSVPVAETPAAPTNLRLAADTVVAGESMVLTGEQLTGATVAATVNGVSLTVRRSSATEVEFAIPQAFPCGAAVTAVFSARIGSAVLERPVVLRTAARVQLEAGSTRTLTDFGRSACVELGVPAGHVGNARFVVAVVNTAPADAAAPSWSLRGVGTGSAAGVASVEQAGGLPSVGRLMAEASQVGDADAAVRRHSVALQQTNTLPSMAARELWRSASALRENAQRGVAALRPALSKPVGIGDTTRFTVMTGSCHRGQSVRARAVYAGANIVVYEDLSAAASSEADAAYRRIGAEYDTVMHPLLRSHMGDPLAINAVMNANMNAATQGDGRIALLLTRVVNDSMPGTAAFVSACNFYPRATFAASNEAAVMYARVPARGESVQEWRRAMRATVMHEAKHLASFAERMAAGREFEEPWLEEATARIAEELYARTFTRGAAWRGNVGFAESVQCEVLECDDRPLIMWKHFTGLHAWLRSASSMRVGQLTGESGTALSASAANSAYASGWALVRWVLDHRVSDERAALQALVAGSSGTGMAALASLGGTSEHELLGTWAASLASDMSPGASPAAVAPGSWRYADIIGGMATMFPGVFASQPLDVSRRSIGDFITTENTLRGSAAFLELSGDFSRGAQVLQLSAGAPGALGLAVRRAK